MEEFDLNHEDERDPEVPVEYVPMFYIDRWVIKGMPAGERPLIMTCGIKTEAEVWELIRSIKLDDDRIDAGLGRPRKYQG